MREILFRGKDTTTGEWISGFLVDAKHIGDWIEANPVHPETVGQFTGMTDKNGKKVFAGDIVLFDYIGANRGVNGKAAVDFNNGKFGVFWGWHKEFVPLDGFANTTMEVIGNIHDQPELMETA